MITHNFRERRKPRRQKETHAPSLPPFCVNFRLVIVIVIDIGIDIVVGIVVVVIVTAIAIVIVAVAVTVDAIYSWLLLRLPSGNVQHELQRRSLISIPFSERR